MDSETGKVYIMPLSPPKNTVAVFWETVHVSASIGTGKDCI